MRRLNASIIGTTGPDPRYRPSTALASDLAQSLLFALAGGACSPEELGVRLRLPVDELESVLGQLQAIGAIRECEDGCLSLGFSLLTAKDLETLDDLVPPLGKALADCVKNGWAEVDAALQRLPGSEAPERHAEFAFATVGCMGLDWHGIATLGQRGHLSAPRQFPDGGRYVLIGEERREVAMSKDYCGSHTAGGERYFFTNFGDHSGPRHSLPDLFFRAEAAIGAASWPPDLGGELRAVMQRGLALLYDDLGTLVAQHPRTLGACADLLRRLGYVDSGEALVPVFTMSMIGPVEEIVCAVGTAVAEWAANTVPGLRRTLAGLTPLRHGVDEGHFLNHIWHFIFGYANRVLCEQGFMLDPEPKPDGQGRYLSWIAEAGFYRAVWPSQSI